MATAQSETKPSLGGTTDLMKRHIVRRQGPINLGDRPVEALKDEALCGASWDRANPLRGEICPACRTIYERLHPGWPIPG